MKSELSEYCKQLSPNKTKRTDKVTKIIIHHMAGILTCEQCASIFAKPSRCASANYLIGRDGKIECNVDEEFRAWTSGSREYDMKAITIEVSNSSLAPNWEVSEVCMKSLIELCADICRRYCIVPEFTGDLKGSILFHSMLQATACPGPYIKSNIGRIVDDINKELCLFIEKPKNENKEKPKENFKKVKVTCDDLNIRAGAGTKYKKVGHITDKGVYTIIEEQGNWGRLKSGAGWICLRYTREVK